MKRKVLEFLRDESGQTATEYILLLAVVALIIYKFKDAVQNKLLDENNGVIGKVFGKMDGLIQQLD